MKNFMQKFLYNFLVCSLLQTSVMFAGGEGEEPVDTEQETTQQDAARLVEAQRLDFELQQKKAQAEIAQKEKEIQNTKAKARQSLNEQKIIREGITTKYGRINWDYNQFKTLSEDYQTTKSNNNLTEQERQIALRQAALKLILRNTKLTPLEIENLTPEQIENYAQSRLEDIESDVYNSEVADRFVSHEERQQALTQIQASIQDAAKLLISEKEPQSTRPIITESYQQYRSMIERSYQFNMATTPEAQVELAAKLLFGDDVDITTLTAEQITQKVQQANDLIAKNTDNALVKAIELPTLAKAQAILLKDIAQKKQVALQREQATFLPKTELEQVKRRIFTVTAEPKTVATDTTATQATPKAKSVPEPVKKSFGTKVQDAIRSFINFFSKTSYIKSITSDALGEYKNGSYQKDTTAIDHIKEKFSDPEIKALDLTEKKELVKALQDQANEFHAKEMEEVEKMGFLTGLSKSAVLSSHFENTCKHLAEAIKPMLSENQTLFTTFDTNGKLIINIIDISTFDFSNDITDTALRHFMKKEKIDPIFKDELQKTLQEHIKKLPKPDTAKTATPEATVAVSTPEPKVTVSAQDSFNAQALRIDPAQMTEVQALHKQLQEILTLTDSKNYKVSIESVSGVKGTGHWTLASDVTTSHVALINASVAKFIELFETAQKNNNPCLKSRDLQKIYNNLKGKSGLMYDAHEKTHLQEISRMNQNLNILDYELKSKLTNMIKANGYKPAEASAMVRSMFPKPTPVKKA